MQTSRVNGLTSGVFAFLEPASCLNQKGSDTRRDNTTHSRLLTITCIFLCLLNAEDGKTCFFPSPGLDN